MIAIQPFRVQLLAEIGEIESQIATLQSRTRISEFRNDPDSPVLVIGPRYYWEPLPPSERDFQARVLGHYRRWFELFSRCYAAHSSDIKKEIEVIDKFVTEAIELNGGWSVEGTHEKNRQALNEKLKLCRDLLNAPGSAGLRLAVVADTNALLAAADPTCYRQVTGREEFDFILVPTVLSELDQIKIGRRDRELGQKAQKVIQRLKGYRSQGSVRSGVLVDRTIMVRMVPTEPRMAELPNWLDPDNSDDRIVGSVLEIQFSEPRHGGSAGHQRLESTKQGRDGVLALGGATRLVNLRVTRGYCSLLLVISATAARSDSSTRSAVLCSFCAAF